MKRLLFVVLMLSMLQASSIKVAVSANVSYAIDELRDEFLSTHKDIKIDTIVASTGKLSSQIIHSAPYDILLGANMEYPQKLYSMGFAISEPKVYAKGALIFLTRKDYDLSDAFKLLKSSKVHKIAIANPKTAPYGIAGVEALRNAGVLSDVSSKLIYGESISQTLTYTLRACDIGLVAKSSIYSPKLSKSELNYKDVDTRLYKPIEQGIVLLKHSKKSRGAREFYLFLLSSKAQRIFQKYGYVLP